jgi:hypothetical protein
MVSKSMWFKKEKRKYLNNQDQSKFQLNKVIHNNAVENENGKLCFKLKSLDI